MQNKYILLLLLLVMLLPGCALLKSASEGLVVTDINSVMDISDVFQLPLDKIPEEYRETYKDVTLVMTRESNLKAGAVKVPISNPAKWDETTISTVLSALMTGLTGFFPWLAGLEGLFALILPRKRQHYASALKNVATLDLREGLKNLAKGLGMIHSSQTTKNVWEAGQKTKASLLTEAQVAVKTL